MKKIVNPISKISLVACIVLTGCTREIDTSIQAGFPTTGDVFIDTFTPDLEYAAWGKVTNFDVDKEVKYQGSASIKIEVPEPNDPMGNWAGGNFYSTKGRDLSQYDALTFYAKSSLPTTITVGFGESGDGKYKVTLPNVKINSNWNKIIIPIPNALKLKAETGLFYYSAGAVDNNGYTLWFDEVKFEKLGTLAHSRIQDMELAGFPGELEIGTLTEIVNLPNGTSQQMQVSPHYFTYESSDNEVASVSGNLISVHKNGTASIRPKEAEGEIKVKGVDVAPTPQEDATKVLSLFSDTYTNTLTANWNPRWEYSTAEYTEINANGNHMAHYTHLNFVGIVLNAQADCSTMNYLHLDLMTLEEIKPDSEFKIEVHNMPPGGNNEVASYPVNPTSHSDFRPGEWLSLDIPLNGLSEKANIAQLVLSTVNLSDIYLDNIFFYSKESGNEDQPIQPEEAAPAPQHAEQNVISLFSDVYSNTSVGTWSADWDMASVNDATVADDQVKRYSIQAFAGIDFSSTVINLNNMTHLHLDLWTPKALSGGMTIKLVDFGADGVYGGDDVEHELALPELTAGQWNSIDIPLSDFTNLTTKEHVAQILLIGNAETLYLDNLYFYNASNRIRLRE